MSPLKDFKICDRVGGPAQKCTFCGCSLLLEHCTAVQVGGNSSKPVFAYFCRRHDDLQIKFYVVEHGKETADPVEEETP
jgi:hypothetical protein